MPALTADTLTLARISTPGAEVTNRPVRSVTTAPSGFEGEAIWRVEVQPHSWGQEVAELIWQGLAWEEVTEDSEAPKRNVAETGWSCRMIVPIEF